MLGMRDTLQGRLLVASPYLDDPNFARSVILLCAHDEGGAFGLIINQPLELAVAEVLPDWAALVQSPAVVFRGGPVQPADVFALCRDRSGSIGSAVWRDLRLLGLDDDATVPIGAPLLPPGSARIFTGYAGWGAGQLEQEILGEGWLVVDPRADDAFTLTPGDLWESALRRPPAARALVPYFPSEPSLN